MNARLAGTTAEFVGAELEQAYATVLGGRVNGGFGDGGRDVLLSGPDLPRSVQVKASIRGACAFLVESQRRQRFIPLCVGNPGPKEKVLASLRDFGAWIEEGLPGRDKALQLVAQIRQSCRQVQG